MYRTPTYRKNIKYPYFVLFIYLQFFTVKFIFYQDDILNKKNVSHLNKVEKPQFSLIFDSYQNLTINMGVHGMHSH